MTTTPQIIVDGQSPFWVRDLDSNPKQPHGWRGTSRGFALIGCEPTTEDDPLRYPLDVSDETANRQATAEWFNSSIFDAIRVLDRCRRYEFVNFDIGDEGPREFTHVAGPYEVEAQTFTAARASTRYRLRCACGAESKWYLGGNLRYLRTFHSAHRCPK